MIIPELQVYYESDLRKIEGTAHPEEFIISMRDVVDAHYQIITQFCESGRAVGAIGIKNIDVLASAVMKPFAGFGKKSLYRDDYEKASALFYGLARNHAFNDGNKRTALITLLLYLHKIGRTPTINQVELEKLAILSAEEKLNNHLKFKDKFDKSETPGVSFLAWHIRNNSRNVDRSNPTITYNELRRIFFSHHGYEMSDPQDSHVTIYSVTEKKTKTWLGNVKIERLKKFATRIGCQSLGKEVPATLIHKVRKELRLTDEDGVDGGVFYKNEEPITRLISDYHSVLQRLADR
jgi:death-on-curing family protein